VREVKRGRKEYNKEQFCFCLARTRVTYGDIPVTNLVTTH
jgi:hypothetical protein